MRCRPCLKPSSSKPDSVYFEQPVEIRGDQFGIPIPRPDVQQIAVHLVRFVGGELFCDKRSDVVLCFDAPEELVNAFTFALAYLETLFYALQQNSKAWQV